MLSSWSSRKLQGRTVFPYRCRRAKSCAKCASGEGHQLAVLAVSYAGGRTRQLSLRREQVGEVRLWLGNYKKLKAALEAICELNHELLRSDAAPVAAPEAAP